MNRFFTGAIIGCGVAFGITHFALPPVWPALAAGAIIGGLVFLMPAWHLFELICEGLRSWFLRH